MSAIMVRPSSLSTEAITLTTHIEDTLVVAQKIDEQAQQDALNIE